MLLNLMNNQRPDINKIDFYVKDPFKSKYQLLEGIKKLKNPKAIIYYS